jgi:hypothetical protein
MLSMPHSYIKPVGVGEKVSTWGGDVAHFSVLTDKHSPNWLTGV